MLPLLAACAIASLPPGVCAQVAHVQQALAAASVPVSSDVMSARITEAASKYGQYGSIARYAQYDVALPRDARERATLHGYGVMLISVIAQQGDELPPKRVVAKVGDALVPLQLFASRTRFAAPDPLVRRVFGASRWEGMYLVPLQVYASNAQVLIDFAKNRDGFAVAQFGERERRSVQALQVDQEPHDAPGDETVRSFLAREYPGFVPQQ